jgi:hypothetical protein
VHCCKPCFAWMVLLATWCSATGRQRINANGFNSLWFILLKEGIIRIKILMLVFQNSTWSVDCSLCLRRSSFITSDLSGSLCPLPCCLCLCWVMTAYLSSFLEGRARPHPPPPCWPHFPARFHVGHRSAKRCESHPGLIICLCWLSNSFLPLPHHMTSGWWELIPPLLFGGHG